MKKLAFIALIIYINCAYADYALPQFAKLFFYDGHIKDKDSCNMPIYSYQILNENPQVIAEEIRKSLPRQEGCRWQEPKLYQFTEDMPALFPTCEEDWIALKNQNNNLPKPQVWEFNCIDSNGNKKHSLRETIYPHYTCAPNRVDITNNQCTTKPYVCSADVVGRDLKLPEFEELGHIGLALNYNPNEPNRVGNYVLQATYKGDVIIIDSLSNFINESPYWGEAYGLDDIDYVSNVNATKAIEAGWNQRLFNPQYTFTSYWQEGKKIEASVFDTKTQTWKPQEAIVPAIFRSDTFVNYCYSKGFNIQLPKSNRVSPKSTYQSFKYLREDVALNPLKQETILYHSAEQQFKSILENTTLNAKDKQLRVWDLLKQAKIKGEKGQFYSLVDRLQFEHAIHLIHNMIEEYLSQDDIDIKRKFQIAIYQAALTQAEQTRTPEEIQKIVEAQAFFLTNLKNEKNDILLKNFTLLAPGIIPKEDLLN